MYLDKGVSSMAETIGISDMPPQPLSCWLADIGVVICAAKTKAVGFERETGGWGGFMVVFIRRKTYLISLLKILHVLKTGDIMVKQATYNIFLKLIINLHFFSEKKEEKEKKPHTERYLYQPAISEPKRELELRTRWKAQFLIWRMKVVRVLKAWRDRSRLSALIMVGDFSKSVSYKPFFLYSI